MRSVSPAQGAASVVRVLPLDGNPLTFESGGATKCVFRPAGGGFLVGPENRLLETAVLAIPRWETPVGLLAQPPVYLFCGVSGTGKTHLLRGLHTIWKQTHRKQRGIYVHATDFARQLAEAIEARTMDDFQERYRRATFLAIDALDELQGKPAAREELLHTLDAVIDGGGVFLAALSRRPEELAALDERLATRLDAGLIVPIALPGPEVRNLFVQEIASAFRVTLSPGVIAQFAEAFPTSLPELYGRFARMYFNAYAAGTTLTATEVKRYLQGADAEERPDIESIIRATACYFGIKPNVLKGRSRRTGASEARAVAIYLAREMLSSSFREIGTHFSGRDHKTISYNHNRIAEALQTEPALETAVREITEILKRK